MSSRSILSPTETSKSWIENYIRNMAFLDSLGLILLEIEWILLLLFVALSIFSLYGESLSVAE